MSIDEISKLLTEVEKICGRSEYITFQLHKKQQEIFDCRDQKEIMLCCSNRFGKTLLAVYMVIAMASGKYAPLNHRKKSYNVCVHSEDQGLNLTVIIPAIIRLCPGEWLDDNIRNAKSKVPTFGIIRGDAAEVTIHFKSGEMPASKLAGAEYDFVHIDESIEEDHFRELKARTVSLDGVILHTYTMVRGVDWSYRYHLANGNKIFYATMYDNPYLPKEAVARYAQELDENERRIRVLGEAVDLSGMGFLDVESARFVNATVKEPLSRYSFEIDQDDEGNIKNVRMVPDERGSITMYAEEFEETEGFLLTADISEGGGNDYTAIDIWKIRCDGLEQFLNFWSNCSNIPQIAAIITKLARHYNDALVNLDATGIGASVLQDLIYRYNYPYIAARSGVEGTADMSSKLGFKFTAASRAYLLAELKKSLQSKNLVVRNLRTAKEMLVYAWDSQRGRYDHPTSGDIKNDDCLMSAGLGVVTLIQNPSYVSDVRVRAKEFERKPMTYDDLMELEKLIEED